MTGDMYREVPAHVDLPALEHEVLRLWHDEKVFDASLKQSAGRPAWVFYEGPPTANGMPGTHHVEARAFKDVFPRFKTMKGFSVPRKAGWDCHGLPVELAVEKELGFTRKSDIESYGVAEFNARCRESVLRHVDAFTAMTERMGYWVDMSQAYWTMDASYVESVWWSLKAIFDKGLLSEDHRVAPYCPRCGTGLSDHELAQGYETVVDPSVYVRFPLRSGPWSSGDDASDLLVWTTTPWTLVSNTAVAVHPEVTYVRVRRDDAVGERPLVVAAPLLADALGDGWSVVDRVAGREMEQWTYQRPFDLVDIPSAHIVTLADYVTTDDGTGLVHTAPAFGPEDLEIAREYDLPVVNPVRSDGTFADDVPLVGGQFFKHADRDLVRDLEERGLLFRHVPYEHSYPHCWRCHTALLYYAQPSWYIRTTQVKDALLRENERTRWHPQTIQWGRYGDWLRNNVDWALSRRRYWGTPLPIWRCPDNHLTCVGSLAELGKLAGRDVADLDPHRPYVDDVTFPCPTCAETATRVPEVIDGWYDSGAMPFAQWGYPHSGTSQFEKAYPADFIAEALDQTRGWFYTLMAVGTLVFDRSSYRDVLCLGIILAEDGRRMSKHLGNILEPMPLMERHGADALRWFMLAGGSPWGARRVGHEMLQEVVRKVLLTYWNTVAFQSLYARTAGWTPTQSPAPPIADRPALDRWAIAEAHRTALEVDTALEDFDTQRAGRALAEYVDDLSNWYVRRSRRRFWQGEPAALATLHECLYVLTLLLAPMTPFVTERVWQDLFRVTSDELPTSVHLAAWPRVDASLVEEPLARQMALVRRVVELGRAARTAQKVRTRQPLRALVVFHNEWQELPDDLRQHALDELNVLADDTASADRDLAGVVERSARPNFRALGKRFGKRTPQVAAAIATADVDRLVADGLSVDVDGERVALDPDEVTLTEAPREGWAVASEPGLAVALDLEVTAELRRAGLAREVVRLVQEARKSSGLAVSDRIAVTWQAEGEMAEALGEHADLVAGEVLAVEFARASSTAPDPAAVDDPALGVRIWFTRSAHN